MSQNPYHPPQDQYAGPPAAGVPITGIYTPQRGALVLALGIIGVVLCTAGAALCIGFPVLGLVASVPAWLLGRSDLRAIAAGAMDPAGRGMTTAGMVMGIVGTAIALLAVVILIVMAIIMAVFFFAAVQVN